MVIKLFYDKEGKMLESDDLGSRGEKILGKAIEAAAVKSVEGIGAFFGAICMPAATEFGLLLKDKISKYRQDNLKEIAQKTRDKIISRKIELSGKASPRLIKEVFEEASWCEDDSIQSMWAGLIAVASGQNINSDDSLVYVDVLKRITPFQARLINHIYWDPRCCDVETPISTFDSDGFIPKNKLSYSYSEVLELFPGDLGEIVPVQGCTHEGVLADSSNQSIAISRFRPQIEGMKTLGLISNVQFSDLGDKGIVISPSLRGLDLFMRGMGYSVYPLEAFVLTLQYWHKLKEE